MLFGHPLIFIGGIMVKSLRFMVRKQYGKIDYLHYFRRMIKDFENQLWVFDIRTIVKNVKVDIPCPKYIAKRWFSKKLCLTLLDEETFKTEFKRYYEGYILPFQELRQNIILARKIWIKKYGYFTKYNQDCVKARYKCKNCTNKEEFLLTKKYSKKDYHVMKLTRIFEILYDNLNCGYWADLVDN